MNSSSYWQAPLAKKLSKLGIFCPFDLILHLPLRYEDESHLFTIAAAPRGRPILLEGVVQHQEVQQRPRRQLLVQLADESGWVWLRFLHFYPSQLKIMACGTRLRALGELRDGFFGPEMVHPKCRAVTLDTPLADRLIPVYPSLAGLPQPTLRRLIATALNTLPLNDTLPTALRQKLGFISFESAIRLLHSPTPDYSMAQLADPTLPPWQRLKFDELLAQQLSMRLAYRVRRQAQSPGIAATEQLCTRLMQSLSFSLTAAQTRVLNEIKTDMTHPYPMHRLLQGDVGSGKTIVATLAALFVLEAGYQVAFMAPTELLAEQHYLTLTKWLDPLGVTMSWLAGSLGKKAKTQVKNAVATGNSALIVGTHALLQEEVHFAQLGLVIVDEQHRFGVSQRLALKNKGQEPHMLMMSATPIPRTLAMSYYADLEVSTIDTLPPGRLPVNTKLIKRQRRDEIIAYVAKRCRQGQQAYWVCPLIEESEALELQAATALYSVLCTQLPHLNVGLIHGRLKPAQKLEVMAAFAAHKIELLVATTVIEVGVDIPNARLIVIEHSERMGLAQLHQLRGRVGRGNQSSDCILLYDEPLSKMACARLRVIYEYHDGFEIARQDLLLRGPGELLGARQSGIPLLRFANLAEDHRLLEQARTLAPELLDHWPQHAAVHLERWLSGKKGLGGV